MTRHDPTTILLVGALVSALAACGNKKEVESAKHSLYDTDFARVYSAALEATRTLYPNLNDAPGPGKIATAWHQVAFANTEDDMTNQRVVSQSQGLGAGSPAQGMGNPSSASGPSPAAAQAGMPTRLAYKRFFIRFDISVVGGRPWRVKVTGHASEWDPGAAMPVELHGVARPPWLEPRTDALTLAIYEKIKPYAIPMKKEVVHSPDDDLPKTDPAMFKNVPPGAAKRLADLRDTLARRDYGSLRPQLADEVVWSAGGGSGADAAMAIWQADPNQFFVMASLLSATCASTGDQKVVCIGSTTELLGYRLVIEPRGDAWRVTAFLKGE